MTAQEIERLAVLETKVGSIDDKIDGLNDKLDSFIAAVGDLDKKYVLRAACIERHRFIDPRQIWAAAAAISIVMPLLTAIAVYYITN